MDKNTILKAVQEARKNSKKRKFSQSFDLTINLKNVDLKKGKLEYFIDLHNDTGKKLKICALVGPELLDNAKKSVDKTVSVDEFDQYQKDKKLAKKLAKEYDVFIAQANIMAKVAQTFGRVFGPLGKMPNPKAGCVVPPAANLDNVKAKIQKLVKLQAIKNPLFQVRVGKEDQTDEVIIDNILTVYKHLESNLPQQINNIGKGFLKLTMGKPVEVA